MIYRDHDRRIVESQQDRAIVKGGMAGWRDGGIGRVGSEEREGGKGRAGSEEQERKGGKRDRWEAG